MVPTVLYVRVEHVPSVSVRFFKNNSGEHLIFISSVLHTSMAYHNISIISD